MLLFKKILEGDKKIQQNKIIISAKSPGQRSGKSNQGANCYKSKIVIMVEFLGLSECRNVSVVIKFNIL